MPAWAMWFLANCLIFILGPVSSSDVCMSLSDVATVVAELVFNGSSLKASQHTSSDLKPHSGHSWTSVHGWHLSTSGLLCRIVSLEIVSENCSFKNKNKNWMEPLWCQLAMKPCAEHFGCCNLAFSKPDIMSRVWIWVGNRGAHTVVICQSQDGPTGWFCKFWRRHRLCIFNSIFLCNVETTLLCSYIKIHEGLDTLLNFFTLEERGVLLVRHTCSPQRSKWAARVT